MQQLSNHFTLEELTHSATAQKYGICNDPPIEVISNLQNLCQQVLEPLREHYGKPIHVSSGYRSAVLNRLVGGVRTSQHVKGEAADLILPSLAEGMLWYQFIRQNCRNYDQCILERNQKGYWWLHVSARREKSMNRHEAFYLVKGK